MRPLFLTLIVTNAADRNAAKDLQDAADSLHSYFSDLSPDTTFDEQLQNLADDYCIYFYLTALKYHTIFIINKDEIKTNILVNSLVDRGIEFNAIDMNRLIATAIKAEGIAANYFKIVYSK